MKRYLKLLSLTFIFTALAACGEKPMDNQTDVPPPASPDPDAPSLSILFIGNSFTQDAVNHLPGMLKAAGIKTVHMVDMYYGGRLIQQYNTGWETSKDYTMYECKPGQSSWTSVKGKSLAEVAASREWDIVTFQEHTGSKYAWTWNAEAKGHFNKLMAKMTATQKEKPEYYYILSQAYQDNGQIGQGSQSSITWTDHVGMWSVVSAFAQNVMKDIPFDGIMSTGAMLENLRTTSLNNDLGLSRDGFHMDYGLARYGASCVLFETLISPVFDVTLDKNSYRFTQTGAGYTPVTDENAPIALEAARNAIKKPFEITDMSNR